MQTMEVSNVCFVVMKDGEYLNKWEIYTVKSNPSRGGKSYMFYYFNTKEDAETARIYLMHKECERVSKSNIGRKYTYNKEILEWKQLLDSLNVKELEAKWSKLKYTTAKKEIKCMI